MSRTVVLNLGAQAVGLAEFRHTGSRGDGGIRLESFRQTEILADPASAEATRLPQIRSAVSGLKTGLRLRGTPPVHYAVSSGGQSLFARFVRLPTAAEDQVERIIGFEAQQNVPFPLDEVVWDYQFVGDGLGERKDGNQLEVVLVAVKADGLDDLNDAVQGAGFRTQAVDAAPLTLLNAFRYNYADDVVSSTDGGCSLLVDLGARTTNLVFVEGTGRFFFRSVPLGGHTVTQALAREFNEPFAAAERRKRDGDRGSHVAPGGNDARTEDDHDPEIVRAAKTIRQVMTRLHAEIGRSVHSYRAQQGGGSPGRVFLAGGAADLPGLREFFVEKFPGVSVEFFNPLRNVTVGPGVDPGEAARHAHRLGELVGLGLRGLLNDDCPTQLNLRPAGSVRARRAASRRRYLAVAAACWLAALAGGWLYFRRATQLKAEAVGRLSARVETMRTVERQFQRLRTETDALTARAAPLTQAIEDRQFYPRLLGELNARLPRVNSQPSPVWITLLEPTVAGRPLAFEDPNRPVAAGGGGGSSGRSGSAPSSAVAVVGATPVGKPTAVAVDGLHVRGLYLANPRGDAVVEDFAKALAQSPYFDLDLRNPKTVILSRAPPTDQAWAFDYELQLRLKPGFAQPLPRGN